MTIRAEGKWQGMNWIRQEKRLAIYLRDGCACAWCGAGIEDGAQLTLDHVVAHSKGGSNHESNLVTCCHRCNTTRGARSAPKFAEAVAGYINSGATRESVLLGVRRLTKRILAPHLTEAKVLIARRGSAAAVLQSKGV